MDHRRLDDLSRFLAGSGSRRRLLKAIVVAAVGGALTRAPVEVAARDKCRGLGETCGTGAQCCSGFCDTAQRPGRCACPPGTTPCGGHAGSPITCIPNCPEGQVLHPYVCQCCTPTESGCIFA
jgi:hypothetical protein